MSWFERGENFWSNADGRFDLFASTAQEHRARDLWVAIDWERGTKFVGVFAAAQIWCVNQMKARPSTLTPAPHAA